MKPRTVFLGTPALVVPILEAVARASDLVAVVTQPDRPVGRSRKTRPPAVKVAAEALGVPVDQPRKVRDGRLAARIAGLAVDLAVVAAYGRILPPDVLAAPTRGCLNVHFSLLPRWRGAAPIQRAILAGDEVTGISIMQMDEGLDTGPVLDQARLAIDPRETAGELGARLSELGARRIAALLQGFPDLPAAVPQDEARATYAPRIEAGEGRLDFAEPADRLVRRVRAMTPWPGAHAEVGGLRLKLYDAEVVACPTAGPPGTVVGLAGGRWMVRAGEGTCVGFGRVQPAGRKVLPAAAFWAGYRRKLEEAGASA